MKKISITILTMSALFLFSCGDEKKEEVKQEVQKVITNDGHEDHTGHDHSGHDHADHKSGDTKSKIVSNDGKKWKLSESLMAAAGEMSNEVKVFAVSDNKDYQALATTLDAGVNKLVNKCELPNGAAHENLHEWLFPYMELIKDLKKTDDAASGEVVFKEIQKSFIAFNHFFE